MHFRLKATLFFLTVCIEVAHLAFFLALGILFGTLVCLFLQGPHESNTGKHQVGGDARYVHRHRLLQSQEEHEAGDPEEGEGHGADAAGHGSHKTSHAHAQGDVVVLLVSDDTCDDSNGKHREHKTAYETAIHANGKCEGPGEGGAQ